MPAEAAQSATVTGAARTGRISRDRIKALKERDNTTNIYYIGRVYLVMAVTIALTVWSYGLVADAGLSWWWNAPMTFIAVLVMGASQHQLGGIIHEGTHYMLFADRRMNELVSDWLGGFPIFTSTYQYRLQHLAHHQFVNDPKRDPDLAQLKETGHWLSFPVDQPTFFRAVLAQLWLPNLVRYILGRLKYSSLGVKENPYFDPEHPGTRWPTLLTIVHTALPPILLAAAAWFGASGGTLGVILLASWSVSLGLMAAMPESWFAQSQIKPVISLRTTMSSYMTFISILFSALTYLHFNEIAPAWTYFMMFWILPAFTAFPIFMYLRQTIQHGNCDRGRFTNTRIFHVNPLLRYAVFPFGMDFHLPHHLNASVPHYKLHNLHEVMLDSDPEYAKEAVVVEGYFWHNAGSDGHPTVVEVLGPDYTPGARNVHIDPNVLEHADINDSSAVEEQITGSRRDAAT